MQGNRIEFRESRSALILNLFSLILLSGACLYIAVIFKETLFAVSVIAAIAMVTLWVNIADMMRVLAHDGLTLVVSEDGLSFSEFGNHVFSWADISRITEGSRKYRPVKITVRHGAVIPRARGLRANFAGRWRMNSGLRYFFLFTWPLTGSHTEINRAIIQGWKAYNQRAAARALREPAPLPRGMELVAHAA